jgi:uncharacterized protein (PEP-CTERM system associated)
MRRKPSPKRPEPGWAGALALALLLGAGAASAQTTRVTPTLSTELTWTDNASAGTDSDGREDWIFEVAPGLSLSRTAGRLNGSLNARLRNLVYANGSEDNTTYLSFDGRGTFEAIEDLLFLDFRAGISRSNYASFTGRGAGDPLAVDDNNEIRYWSIAPRLESDLRFGESARGSVKYSSQGVDSSTVALGNQRADTWDVAVSDPGGLRVLGWGLDYSRTDSDTGGSGGGTRAKESVRGTLYGNVSPQLRLRAIVGRESNDYAEGRKDSSGIVGGGIDWYPTERSSISATAEDRIFGSGYDFSFNHRMRRAVFFVGAGRDLSSFAESLGYAVVVDRSCVDLVADPGYRPDVTDRLERQSLLLDCLSFGQLRSNAAFVERSVRGGFSLLGVRNTLSFSASRSDRSRLGGVTGLLPEDDLLDSERVRVTTVTLAMSHTLSGTSSLYASLSRSHSESADDAELDTQRFTGTVGVDRSLGPHTRAGLRYRYQKAEGSSDYTENALTATLGMRF